MHKLTAELLSAMIHYDRGDAARIHHLVKVHGFARTIGILEGMETHALHILEAAAIVHDIGIHPSLRKYGSSAGKYQELEGPPEAEKLMRSVGGYAEEEIERVKYLVGRHHTYTDIDGLDYQILIEADFLVNLHEHASEFESAQAAYEKIFKTATGKQLLVDLFMSKADLPD